MINSDREIIQIVPQLPPNIGGVADYALNLADRLRKDWGIETRFIVGDPSWQAPVGTVDFNSQPIDNRSAKSLLSLLPSDRRQPVLLHYSGYGYAKRGAPFWLVESLNRWKQKATSDRLVTMFHEVYAFRGRPWTSSFWLSDCQKNLAARLARLSDRCLTSGQYFAQTINSLSPEKHSSVPILPVFSNITEPDNAPPSIERARKLSIFGHPHGRLQVYQQQIKAIERLCHSLEIEEIYDIGIPIDSMPSQINGIPIVEVGAARPDKVSEILLDSIAGFLGYHLPQYLAKSTIFAAYAAHRLIPVLTSGAAFPIDGLEAGKHYWVANGELGNLSLDKGQAIADRAYNWYQTHTLSAQSQIFAAQLAPTEFEER
ncbi:MAG: hypothetical protein KME17_15875 [Cyanosarcina radialis HA8281-LM2]|jgi:hypothetical protein|nr:hypothetical protein [Cyanosarcina radialis HA8281-LM2]